MSIEVKADTIDRPDYFPRTSTHGGNWFRAKGNVEVDVRKQHPGSRNKDVRPEAGTVLEARDDDIVVTARYTERKNRPSDDGRRIATASGGVRIFGKLRRHGS